MDIRGVLYVLAAASMWGMIGVFTKYILAEGISALEIAFWRAGFAWIIFVIHASFTRELKAHRSDLPLLLIFGVVCVTTFYGSYQLAIRDAGVALAAVLLYTAPAWVAVLSCLVLKERMTPLKTICVTMTLAGVACICLVPRLMSGGDLNLNTFGLIAGLVSGMTYALYYIFGKKYLYKYATPTIFVYALPAGALPLLPFVDFHEKTLTAWLLLLALGAITSYGAFSAYYAGLKRLEATKASVIATFEPVVAATLAFALFGERFTLSGYVGSALIISAVFLVVLASRNPKSAPTAQPAEQS
ncbi:DMT family transporter [Pseudodesulfovibrio tunisiensis]|uniref:DMT family transporter n=1 Tax=Pseudodesulfovibrio tunisiensis TaxID=463192 RepID=UPI001FB43A73|nr:EamA family transporter [Pseudodesulfovibrio tunisiensis]